MRFDSREYNYVMTPLHNLKDRVYEYFPPLPPENTNTVKRSTKNMGRDKLHQTSYPILKQFYSQTERFYDYDSMTMITSLRYQSCVPSTY